MPPATWLGFKAAMDSVLADSGSSTCIVADSDEALVGSVFLYPGGARPYPDGDALPEPEFRMLAVAPNARGRGIGRALVEECIRRARAAGARELGLHSSRSFRSAVAMYERMGFARVPERDFHPPGAEVVEGYRLTLSS